MKTSRNMRGDLETVTEVELTPALLLKVETSKRSGGKVSTDASVYVRDRGFLSHSFCFGSRDPLDGNFRRVLLVETARATAKTLERQHGEAILLAGGIEALSRDALAHEQARAARKEVTA